MDYKLSEKKFRAWDEENQHMAYQGTPDLETIQSFIYHWGDKELMLSTVMFDNTKFKDLTNKEQEEWLEFHTKQEWKGREIFEGDVVLYTVPSKIVGNIVLKNGAFLFEGVDEETGWFISYLLRDMDLKHLTVIGHIFQKA